VPTFVFGLPLHPLVVHAVVVLVPLAALGTAAVALWPTARRRFGWLVVVVTALATLSIPVATSSGEGLEHSLPRSPAIGSHAELGDQLLPLVAALLVAATAVMVLDRLTPRRAGTGGPAPSSAPSGGVATVIAPAGVRVTAAALAVVTVALAVLSTVQVVRIGDSGARAAWGDTRYVQQTDVDD
jgi:hypothetical protein